MMLLCPKCGDYYADGSLAFCLADGTPLVSVEPNGESWSQGSRIIEQKENALRKHKRRLKWRRVSSVLTMLIITMTVYAIVAKRYIYLVPPPSPSPTPSWSPSPMIAIKETPTPAVVIKETPTPTIVIKVTPTPVIAIKVTPTPVIVIKETPTPTIVIKETTTPTPTPTPTPKACSDADEGRDEQIIRSYLPTWRRNIQGERAKIIAENVPEGARSTEAILREIELQVTFLIPCKSAAITAGYEWQVSYSLIGAPPKTKIVSRKRTIACGKVFGMWVCR
jgi:hypothetical protein